VRVSDTEVVPLPPGDWHLNYKTELDLCAPTNHSCKMSGRALVITNRATTSAIRAVVIRHTNRRIANSRTDFCYKKFSPYQDTHGTKQNQLLNLCSHGFRRNDYPRGGQSWWWLPIQKGLENLEKPRVKRGGLIHFEFLLQNVNQRRFYLDVWIESPADNPSLNFDTLMTWKKAYMEVLSSSVFTGTSANPTILAQLNILPIHNTEVRQLLARLSETRNQLNFITQSEGIYSAKYKKLSGEIKDLNEKIQIASRKTKADSRSEPNQSVSGRPQTAQTERQMQASVEAERKAREEELAKQQAELERQRAEVSRQDAERKEAERLAQEAAARERVAKAEAEEQRRIAAEVARKKAEREEAQRLAQEAAERERVAKAQAEEQRRRLAEIARQDKELRRQEAARAEAERLAKEAAEKERLAKEEVERQRIAAAAREVESAAAQLKRLQEALSKLKTQTASSPSKPVTPPLAPRYALVVGNAKYKSVSPLENSVADAKAFAKQLSNLGFKVSLHTDLRERQFNRAVRDFKQQLSEGDEIVFYYAGHGIQVAGTNYLLPTDVGGESIDQIRDEAVELQRVLDSLAEKNTKFTLAVLDACRDNPFKGNKRAIAGRGLAPTSAATGQMIIFSAGAGQQALDNLGSDDPSPNGLFTRIFLKEMVKPGVPIDSMLRKVRREVVRLAKSVGHEQVPALYDQTVGEFFFKPE
jgi:hypothetical protein